MKYEVWTRAPDHDSQSVVMKPELSHDNERELMQQGYQVCHTFEAISDEDARRKLSEWIKTKSMERFCDGHAAWECTEDCLRPVELSQSDLRRALEKYRTKHPRPDDTQQVVKPKRDRDDARYITSLEDENAELHAAMKEGQEVVHALRLRIHDLERDYKAARAEAPSGMGALDLIRKELNAGDDETSLEAVRKLKDKTMALVDRNAQWAELSESLGWYDPPEVKALIDIRTKAAAAALDAIERGHKVIEALMPGLRHIAVQNYQEVNEAPIAMAQAADALREALGVSVPEMSDSTTPPRLEE